MGGGENSRKKFTHKIKISREEKKRAINKISRTKSNLHSLSLMWGIHYKNVVTADAIQHHKMRLGQKPDKTESFMLIMSIRNYRRDDVSLLDLFVVSRKESAAICSELLSFRCIPPHRR